MPTKLEKEIKKFYEGKNRMITSLDDYQEQARKTAIYPDKYKVTYPALGLASEAGEVAGKVKKILRDTPKEIKTLGDLDKTNQGEMQLKNLAAEIGDVLWYCAVLAEDCGITLSHIANQNIAKLQSRKLRGVLQGSGDSR